MKLLIFLFLAIFLCGCSEKLEKSKESFKIFDRSGKEFEFKKAPERAIFLSGESWIYALRIKEKVVAVSDLAKMNPTLAKIDPEISKIPSVGDMNRINEEAILSLKPDVVVVWDEPPGYKENAKRLERLGIPIVGIGYIEANPEVWIISYYAGYNESAIILDPAFSNVEAVKKKAIFKEPFMPMQFLEPYFLLTVQQYRSWIIGDVDPQVEEEIPLKKIYG